MATHDDSVCLSTTPGIGRYSDLENEIIIPAVLEVMGGGSCEAYSTDTAEVVWCGVEW